MITSHSVYVSQGIAHLLRKALGIVPIRLLEKNWASFIAHFKIEGCRYGYTLNKVQVVSLSLRLSLSTTKYEAAKIRAKRSLTKKYWFWIRLTLSPFYIPRNGVGVIEYYRTSVS
jgi:hypothetical protein